MPLFCRTLLKKVAFFNIRLIAIFFFSLSRAISRRVRIPRVKFGAGTKVELNIKLPRQKKISFQRTFRIFMFCQSCIAPKNVLRRYTPMISYARNQEQKRKRLPLPLPPFSFLSVWQNERFLAVSGGGGRDCGKGGGGRTAFFYLTQQPAARGIAAAGRGRGGDGRRRRRHWKKGKLPPYL